MLTTDVENFPGFVDGIMGPDLMGRFRAQAERFGAEYLTEKATRVDFSSRPFRIWTGSGTGEVEHRAHAVIVATGARALMLGLESESRLLGYGVSTCATCDGFFFRGQHIAVIGGGDSAMEEASFLTRFGETVTIVHRRDEFRASKIMAERALANPKINVVWNSVVTEVLGKDGKVAGIGLRNTLTGADSTLDVTGVFVAIGHVPRSDMFVGQVDLDPSGYVLVDAPGTRTSVPGVFAAGDVVDHTYRQAITAAGTGCAAALDAERYIAALED